MENQGSKEKYVSTKPRHRFGITRILREAHKITIKNGNLVVLILLPVLVSYTVLEFCSHLLFEPISKDLSSKAAHMPNDYFSSKDALMPNDYLSSNAALTPNDHYNITELNGNFMPNDYYNITQLNGNFMPNDYYNITQLNGNFTSIIKDVRYVLRIQSVFFFISCVISLIFLVASIYSSSEAYVGKVLSLKDTLYGVKGRIIRPIITSFWMVMISSSLIGLFLTIFGIIAVMTEGFYIVLVIILASILGIVCYFYVAALWMLSLVVSVLEEKSYGLKAIDRAGELMKGKRIQGSVLKLLKALSVGVIYMVFFLIPGKGDKMSSKSMVIMIPSTWLICLVELFMFEVFTVFYHECKKSQEAESELVYYALVNDTGEA